MKCFIKALLAMLGVMLMSAIFIAYMTWDAYAITKIASWDDGSRIGYSFLIFAVSSIVTFAWCKP